MTEAEIRAKYGLDGGANPTSPAPAPAADDHEAMIRQKYGLAPSAAPAPASIEPPVDPNMPTEYYAKRAYLAGDKGGIAKHADENGKQVADWAADDRSVWDKITDPYGQLKDLPPNSVQARNLRASRGSEETIDKAVGYLPGLANTGFQAGVNRVTTLGKDGNTNEDWIAALKGQAKSGPQLMLEKGWSPYAAYPLGILGQALSDPTAAQLGGGKKVEEGASMLRTLMNAATQQVKSVPGVGALEKAANFARAPLRNIGQSIAEKTYRNAFRAGDSVTSSFANSAKKGSRPYSKLLWNQGEPVVGGWGVDDKTLMDQLRAVTEGEGERLGNQIEEAGQPGVRIDLAPELQGNVENHIAHSMGVPPDLLKESGMSAPEYIEDGLQKLQELHDQVSELRKGVVSKAKLADEVPDTAAHDLVMKGFEGHMKDLENIQQALTQDPHDYIKKLLYSKKPAERSQGLVLLKDSAHEKLGDTIANAGEGLAYHAEERGKSMAFFDALLGNLAEGERTLPGIQRMRKDMGAVAAGGSSNTDSNAFKVGTKKSGKTANNAKGFSDLGDVLNEVIHEQLGARAVSQRAGWLDNYSTLIRGQKPMLQKIATAERRTPTTGTEAAGWAFTAGKALTEKSIQAALPYIAAMTAGKVGKELRMSPAFSAKVGRGIKHLSDNNLWDSVLRTALRNSEKGKIQDSEDNKP